MPAREVFSEMPGFPVLRARALSRESTMTVFPREGATSKVSVRNWSDTTTFLFQAEVFRPQISDLVRMTYPIILGTSLNFTLPPTAEGPSVEAELNGENIIFPLGPIPILSWADCNVSVAKDQARFYRCELNAGYRFR